MGPGTWDSNLPPVESLISSPVPLWAKLSPARDAALRQERESPVVLVVALGLPRALRGGALLCR